MTLTARPKIPSRRPNRSARSTLRGCGRARRKRIHIRGPGQAIPAADKLVGSETISNLDLCRGDKFSRNGRKTTCGRKKQLAQKNETNCGRSAARRSRRSTLVTSWFPDRSLGQLLVGGYRSSRTVEKSNRSFE